MSAKIISGAFMHSEANKALKGKIVHAVNVRGCEAHLTFADGTILEIKPSKTRGDQLWFDLYEYQPAQTKLSLTAWREYRQFDGELLECFEQFFRAFCHEVLDSKLTGTDNRCHDWNSYHWGKLQANVIDDLRAGIELQKLGRVRDTSQFSLEWDFEGTNKREETDILFTASFWVLGCDVSYDSPVLSARIYLLPADQVNATEKMGKGR